MISGVKLITYASENKFLVSTCDFQQFVLLFYNEMSNQAAALQALNNELIKCIEEMSMKRDEIHRQIIIDEAEKKKVEFEIRTLTERLASLVESLSRKYAVKKDCDRTITETESAYMKIVEGSQTLVHTVKKGLDSVNKAEGQKNV